MRVHTFKGFIKIVLLPLVAILFATGLFVYFKLAHPDISFYPKTTERPTEKIDVGHHSLTLKSGDIYLPSGSYLHLGSGIYEGPWFYFDSKSDYYDYLPISNSLTAHSGGYIFYISKKECRRGNPSHDSPALIIECDLEIDVSTEKFKISSYKGISKSFSTLETKNDKNKIVVNETDPLLIVEVPYTQIYNVERSGNYDFATGEHTLSIYTHYGKVVFTYEVSELFEKSSTKTTQLGPLSLTLKITNLSCYQPYECNSPQPNVYNRVDFNLYIVEESVQPQEVKIVRYEI